MNLWSVWIKFWTRHQIDRLIVVNHPGRIPPGLPYHRLRPATDAQGVPQGGRGF